MNKILPGLFKFLEYSPVVLAFILPLFFLPLTTEYFETAKVSFFYIFTVVLFLIWSVKMVSEKKVSFVRSRLDLPLILMGTVFALSTLLSPNKYTAIFGSYLRFQPSLLFTLAFITLYYTLSANFKNRGVRRLSLITFVLSVGLSSAWAALSFLGTFEILPLPQTLVFLQSRVFNTTGSLSILSTLAAIAFILGLGLVAKEQSLNITNTIKATGLIDRYKTYVNYLLTASLFSTLAVVVLYSTLPGWAALVIGLVFLALLEPQILLRQKATLLPLAVWSFLLLLILLAPSVVKGLNISRQAEVVLPLPESWIIASQTIVNSPLVGAGLGQFPNLFNLFKPVSFNSSPLWNFRFDRPINEALLLLSEMGLLGLGVTLLFLAKVAGFSLAAKGKEGYLTAVRAGLMAMVVVYFVTVNSTLLGFTLILLLAILVGSEENDGSKISERVIVMISTIKDRIFGIKTEGIATKISGSTQILPYLFLGVSVLASIFVITAVSLGYGAEYYNRRYLLAVGRNNGNDALNSELKAISYNPNLDVYQRGLGQLALGIAANISGRPNVTDRDRQTISDLIQESIRRVRIASEIIEPASVANWEARAQIYQNLIGVAQNAEQWAVDSYARAISLDPINPNLRITLGGIYFGLKNYDLAANSFSQAASLKQDLANAHYNLAQALLALNRRADALGEYNVVLNLIGTGSSDYPQALKERDALAKLLAEESNKAAESANTVANPSSPLGTNQEKLSTPPPTSNLQKKSVDALNLGKLEEASPAAGQ